MKYTIAMVFAGLLVGCGAPEVSNTLTSVDDSFRTKATVTDGEADTARMKIEAVKSFDNGSLSSRGTPILKVSVLKYEFERPWNPWGEATYEANDAYTLTLTCDDFTGSNDDTLVVKEDGLWGESYTLKVSNCANLREYLKRTQSTDKDILFIVNGAAVSITIADRIK